MSFRLVAAMAFALAAALAVTEIVSTRQRRLTIRRARQQVGLLDADVDEQKPALRGWSPRLIIGSLSMAVIGTVVAGPVGLVFAAAPALVSRSWSNRQRRRRQEALADELGPALQMIIGHLRIGRNVSAALVEVAESCTGPLREVLTEVVAEARLGSPLDEVLTSVAEREGNRHLGIVASAVGLHARHGGSLVEILDTVVETIEEEDRLRRDIKSLTADGRLSAKVLLAMPPAMLAIISVLSPGYATPLANTSFGRMLAMVGVVLGLVGWQWLRHLATPKVVA
jgi:tight adherence protein B